MKSNINKNQQADKTIDQTLAAIITAAITQKIGKPIIVSHIRRIEQQQCWCQVARTTQMTSMQMLPNAQF